MNPILQSLNNIGETRNGAVSYKSTGSACLDLFSKVGSARNMDKGELINKFYNAGLEDMDVATRIMMWTRDARGGAGERSTFRKLAAEFETWCADHPNGRQMVQTLIDKAVELGRWDDIFVFEKNFDLVVNKVGQNLTNELLLKWLPREKSAKGAIAKRLAKGLGLTPRQYRKVCAGVVTTETLMCAKRWNEINLSHVPSVAASRYQKAFEAKHPGYQEWKAALEKGEEKVNASVSFPHDVYRAFQAGTDRKVIDAMWEALPNYIPEGVNILPISDVSGSMSCRASGSVSCMDVSVSLGAYLATKNTGPFAGALITFDDNPKFHWMDAKKGIAHNFAAIARMPWGGSTNFQATFDLILAHAKKVGAKQEDMPQFVLCLSDMQFNAADGPYNWSSRSRNTTNFEAIAEKYEAAGYKMPTLVFWNLNAGYGNDTPATAAHKNVALVSGFSPAVLKAVLAGGDTAPVQIMLDTVMHDRYKVL